MSTVTTDVLVIGSGFGAAAPALRLAEAGHRVLVIEKGMRPRFRQTQDPTYVRDHIKSLDGDNISMTFAEALGGGSGFYEMVSLRAPSIAFEQLDRTGRPLWPAGVDRRALDPYFDLAESMLGVQQIPVHEVPKTGLVFARLMKNLGYSCDRARYAVRGCVGSGFCVTGCVYGAKQSLLLNYLPRAEAAGATIEVGTQAEWIRPLLQLENSKQAQRLSDLPYRYEVICRSTAQPNGWRRIHARIVVLGGGTVGTAQLLLASRKHLPRLSRHVGRNIAFNGSAKAVGILPEDFPDGDMFTGRSHPGMISYEFLQSLGLTVAAAKPLPLQAVASARLRLDGDGREPWYWGQPNVDLMQLFRRRMIVLVSFGLTPPGAELSQREDGRVRPRLRLTDTLREQARQAQELLESILTRNQCRLVHAQWLDGQGAPRNELSFSTAHQTGSCRMADSKRAGVVDALGEVFDYPGLYVTDGAAVPSSLAVNTSLTILANAERIAAGILDRHPPRRVAAGATRRDLREDPLEKPEHLRSKAAGGRMRRQLSLASVGALVSALALPACALNRAAEPTPAWSLTAGAGFISGGPAGDLETVMRRQGLNGVEQCWIFCDGVITYPRSRSGAFFTATLLRRLHDRAAIGVSYSNSDLGSTAGYRSTFERITIGSRMHSVAPVASGRAGPLRLLAGPALHSVQTRTAHAGDGQGVRSSSGVGVIGEVALEVSEARPVYADIGVRYQRVGSRAIGPFLSATGVHSAPLVEVPRTNVGFDHFAFVFSLRIER